MKILFSLLFVALTLTTYSQSIKKHRCHQEKWLQEMEEKHPGYIAEIEKGMKDFRKKIHSSERINITIPVHVIIVHPTGQPVGTGSNHSLAHVQSQIDVLNQDFGRYNADAGNTPPDFPAADTGIQFCLATVDPNGNPTDGITRYPYDGAFHPNAPTIRSETRWPRETYANIWSAPNLPYLGLASVPSTFALPSPNNDFMHVDAAAFGGPGFATFPNYNLGRTTTHEMGHYLGLFHVWGNGGCGSDDGISDTPLQNDSNFGCPNHPSPSCGNSGDMFMNYMDYVNDNCMNAFTQEQGDYMNTILSTSRASLNGASFTACATSVPLEINVISVGDPNCTDSNDGFILVEGVGGNPDYSYSLNGGVPTSNGLFTDLPGGNYTLEVFDLDGQSASVMVFLNTPLPLTAEANVTQTNTCPGDANGSVQILVAGGSNPYTYTLGMGMSQSSNVFNNLTTGFYVVNIVDDKGCMLDLDFEITSDTEIEITIDSTADLTCSNDDMGLIIASAEGGNGPLAYSIDGVNFQDHGEFNDLDGGMYYVYVQDTVGCYDSLGVTLAEPDPFFISVEATDVSCNGDNDGSVQVMAMGGNGSPYQYSFDSLTFGDTTILDSLFAGEYDLYALDSLGCIAFATFDIEEPEVLTIAADTIINVECYGDITGSMTLLASGGNGGYMYIFNGDTTATAEFDNLEAGSYLVYVFDANGCEGSGIFEVAVNSQLNISVAEESAPSCNGDSDGMIEVISSNTQGTVMYAINGGPLQESPIFAGLSDGEYNITVEDTTGCAAVVKVTLVEPEVLSLEINSLDHLQCHGDDDGGATFFVHGGTGPFTETITPAPGPNGLTAGDYTILVTDNNECTAMLEFTIEQPEPVEVSIVDQTEADCDTQSGAELQLDAQGGTSGYHYSITGPSGTMSNLEGSFEDLQFGTYDVLVTDAVGCIGTSQVDITLENMLFAEIAGITDIPCFAQNGGGLNIDVSGGIGEITYYLDGAMVVDPSKLDTHAGDHTITVVDENNCMIEIPFTLLEPEELVIDEITMSNDEQSITVTAAGGTEPYMFSFDGGDSFSTDNTTDDLSSGMIHIVIQDANGCEVETIFIINDVTDLSDDWGINAYPNPFQNELFLTLDFPTLTKATIEVFDVQGRKVHNILAKNYNSGENFVKIDLSNFASSIYIIKIASAEGYRYIKATKM